MGKILVINSGSSSIKYQLFEVDGWNVIVDDSVERIGEAGGVSDHEAGLHLMFDRLQKTELNDLTGIGHRVVHGGEEYAAPVLIDIQVIEAIRSLIPLAPLHNPANLAGIEVAAKLFPAVPQVAVFDTAFHQTMPEHAWRYALPESCYRDLHVRRYGFHGTSHQYVAKQAAHYLQQSLEELNLITLHLGNGASMAAVRDGHCIDTTMGMTPLEGLMMGSRCGDLDPAVPFYLAQAMGKSNAEINELLNEESGLKAISGANDMREVHQRIEAGEAASILALEMYCYRIRKYIGAYCAALGRVDALVFTAGIGEHDVEVRRRSCEGLERFGIIIDTQSNNASAMEIQQVGAAVKLLVIPTNEEREIAEQTLACISTART
jgi:acetate kinase